MARYFFDLDECGDGSPDPEGIECEDQDQVLAYATHSARTIMADEVCAGRLCLGCSIKVRNEMGAVVRTVLFRDVLTISGV